MFSLSPVVTGPLSQKFTVSHPPTNDWSVGGSPNNQGVIVPANKNEAQLLPEGTRLHQAISIYASQPIGFGDVVTWKGEPYKITHFEDFSDSGYYYGLAVLTNEPANPDQSGFIDV